jgi:hypothetical protein
MNTTRHNPLKVKPVTHHSFEVWVEADILPKKCTQGRLDGHPNGRSNHDRKINARFKHQGRTWEVHGDTRIEVVLRAYYAVDIDDPLVTERTNTNKRYCLNLAEPIRKAKEPKYFYVYEIV